MKSDNRLEQIAGIVALVLLVVGCFLVLRPFVSALLWAAILCYSTWPLYSRLERALRGRRALAATLMTLLIAVVLVAPFLFVAFSLADNFARLIGLAQTVGQEGLPDLPASVGHLPVVGGIIETHWRELADNPGQLVTELKGFLGASREFLVHSGLNLGHGILLLILSVFIGFFFYRDGVLVADRLSAAVERVAGDQTQHLLGIVGGTVKGVVYGVLGTSLVLGILAGLGFWISGVPAPLLLGLATFFLSFVPFGSPLVWVPAGLWLIWNGSVGWGVFLLVWCSVISFVIDHIAKPYLISRESNLPFILVFLGVLGGILAFGFIGIFIGPTLLAVGYSLVHGWISEHKTGNAEGVLPKS